MSHDQNFKNLILDYPLEALKLFAATEAQGLDATVRIIPIRQEQLKARLGDKFRELDVPLLLEWPDGRREALFFALEETQTCRFSVHRLAHYCLDLSEMFKTERVVPVVIFLNSGNFSKKLQLGSDGHCYLAFHFLWTQLPSMDYNSHKHSENIVTILNLPNMAYKPEQKIDVYAAALRGLLRLEEKPAKRLKYLDFIDIYANMNNNELQEYRDKYPREVNEMSAFADRFIEQGMKKGIEKGLEKGLEQGVQRGEAKALLKLLQLKFGAVSEATVEKIESAHTDNLSLWLEKVLSADQIEDIF